MKNNFFERTTKDYIRDLFRHISYSRPEFVNYVLDNDYEIPEHIENLCYRYFEEWNKDAKLMTLNKPSEHIFSQIANYYNL